MELIHALRSNGAVRSFTDRPGRRRHPPRRARHGTVRAERRQPPAVARGDRARSRHPPRDGRADAHGVGGVRRRERHRRDRLRVRHARSTRRRSPHPTGCSTRSRRVPVVLAVAADLRHIAMMDGNLERPPVTGGASIYPFCWSILLAGTRARPRRRAHHVPRRAKNRRSRHGSACPPIMRSSRRSSSGTRRTRTPS